MSSLTKEDMHFVMSRVPKDIREIMQQKGLVLAGGFIRETIARGKVNDIDLFGTTKEALKAAATELALNRKGRLHETENAFTVLAPPRMPVQFITRWLVDTPSEYIDFFDFTVCQAAIWFEQGEWRSAASPYFYPDLAARRLTYTFPRREEDAGGSMLRVRKFISRGYDIQVGSLAGVMARVFRSIDMEKIRGNDEAHVSQIIHGILREVDPLAVVDGFDVSELNV